MTREDFCESAIKKLYRVESGEVRIELVAGSILERKVESQTGSGWKIIVFRDRDVWDSVRSITPPTKEHIDIWPEKEKDDCEGFQKSWPTIRPLLNSRPRGDFYPDPMRGRGVLQRKMDAR